MKFESKTVHSGDRKKSGGNWIPATTPIHTASTYLYDSTEQLDRVMGMEEPGPSYARFDNPTRNALEDLMTDLESGAGTITCASGMAALHLGVLGALLDRPKRVLAADALYGTTTFMLMNVFGPLGVDTTLVNVFDPAAVEAAVVKSKPGAIVVETISNPLLRVAPLDHLSHIARKHDVPLLVDNTFATPMMIRPLELGASMSIHSVTKYLAGHGDVLGGVIVADDASFQTLRPLARTLGPVLSPFDCYLTMRGIKTLALRMERQCANACRIAQWLGAHPAIERVYFPGDPAHPDAAAVARLFPKGLDGALVSFEIKGADRGAVMAFMDRLQMLVRGTSLGDVHTLVAYPVMASHRDISPKQRKKMGIRDNLVRMSVGIEASDDIVADLDRALAG